MYRTPRRTFRPDALDDRLETRDLLTVLAGLPVSLSSAGLGLGMSSPITTTSYTSVVHYVTPSSNSTRSFTRTVIARPTVSTVNLGLVNAGFFVNNSAALSSLTNGEFNPGYASTTGLAFTNGLGFNSLAAQSQFYNTATNGLIFNNGTAAAVTPASVSNFGSSVGFSSAFAPFVF